MRNYDNSSAGFDEINENSRGTWEEGVKKGNEILGWDQIFQMKKEEERTDRLIVTNTDPGLPNYKLMS